jgi:hypothetical protein
MSDTNFSLLSLLVTSFMAATLFQSTMCDACSSLHDLIVTPLKAALLPLHLCAMCDTHTSLLGMVVTPLMAATFTHCAVGNANSSLHELIVTPLKAA